MSRKDIIIISVLINAGLLAVLFVTALKTDPEASNEGMKTQETQVAKVGNASNEIVLNVPQKEYGSISSRDSSPDEVDMVLKEYLPEMVESSPISKTPQRTFEEPKEVKEEPSINQTTVDVVVKSGDALEKIARANRTTVDAIRKASNLSSDKLKIGQVLKVPVGTVKAPPAPKEVKSAPSNPVSMNDAPVYYVIKPGDNPWKIAKLHDVKFDDLLILNNLDEERAKNLKVGEKIRVR
jgi:LysM repeat protein